MDLAGAAPISSSTLDADKGNVRAKREEERAWCLSRTTLCKDILEAHAAKFAWQGARVDRDYLLVQPLAVSDIWSVK